MIVGNWHGGKLRDDASGGSSVRLAEIIVVDETLAWLRSLLPDVTIVLLGDFNAEKGAPELAPLFERGLVLATESCAGATKITDGTIVDHIWVWPAAGRPIRELTSCIVYGLEEASDHRPVVATFEI